MAEEQQITAGEQVPDDEPLLIERQTPEEQVPSKQKVGNVYVQFREEEHAQAALQNLTRRFNADTLKG
ncbi:hypothetical protein C1H46_037663 [Malus baccata]|uniref:Uncharacterized protein n=1 Tax=Malus baccata TaxID=106549 RepID=A0A540KRE9_MALBA|nr:hypothetical protein C1H46_037663 [Malus baccata]